MNDIVNCNLGKIESVQQALELVAGFNQPDFLELNSKPNSLKELIEYPKDPSYQYTYPFPFGIWFRGVINSQFKLLPSVFRKRYKEGAMFSSFKLYNPSYHKTHQNNFDWLTLMQHYNLPTRLLDWSESFLAALFFAVSHVEENIENANTEADGRLYILNARRLNRIYRFSKDITNKNAQEINIGNKGMLSPESIEAQVHCRFINGGSKKTTYKDLLQSGELFADDYYDDNDHIINWLKGIKTDLEFMVMEEKILGAVAIFPSRLNLRMQAQQSMFTLHGGKIYVDSERFYPEEDQIGEPISLEELNKKNISCLDTSKRKPPFLMWFDIPKEAKSKIKEELRRIGIHNGSLFPEIDHQSDYLKKIWNFT